MFRENFFYTSRNRVFTGIPFIPVYRYSVEKQPATPVYREIFFSVYTGINGLKYTFTVGNLGIDKLVRIDLYET